MLFVVNLVASSDGYQDFTDHSAFLSASTDQALRSIKNAEASGVDTDPLIEKFNVAMDLVAQAEYEEYISCPSYDECVLQANTILLSIVDRASSSSNQASARNEQLNTMTFTVYLPAISFVISIVVLVTYRTWKSRKLKRFQTLNIQESRHYDD
jgi:hypothetical protein